MLFFRIPYGLYGHVAPRSPRNGDNSFPYFLVGSVDKMKANVNSLINKNVLMVKSAGGQGRPFNPSKLQTMVSEDFKMCDTTQCSMVLAHAPACASTMEKIEKIYNLHHQAPQTRRWWVS